MPPKTGWKKGEDGRFYPPRAPVSRVVWRKEFVPFGDRLNFLSPEVQHLNTGRLSIMPPRGERKRK